MMTLCKHISCSPKTLDDWVAQGILPPPRKRGGELMWKWSEVDDYLTHGGHQASDIDRIREATRRIFEQVPTRDTPTVDHQDAKTQIPNELLADIRALVDEVAKGRTLFVSDAEMIRRIGAPREIARAAFKSLDAAPQSGFPKKHKLWGNKRYWPAVIDWFDQSYRPTLKK
jgi:predicted DNA-binding transcriptional regulator AlpA